MSRLEVDLRLRLREFELRAAFETDARSLGVFGPSGCGKTSLLESMLGLRKATGRVAFAGETWLDTESKTMLPVPARRVGFVPQAGLLFPHMSVAENLRAGRHRGGAVSEDDIVALLGIGARLDDDVRALSGGERQRVALGRALLSGAQLLMLDEPFSSLDLGRRRTLIALLARVRDELQIPMVLISHDPLEMAALVDEVVVLERGTIARHGTQPETMLVASDEIVSVLRGEVVQVHEDRTVMDLGGETLSMPLAERAEGESIMVSVLGSDVVLATAPPENISTRNVLGAVVTGVQRDKRRAAITLELRASKARVVARLLPSTVDRLSLKPGDEVWAIIKGTAVRALG